ncbi:MAG TPA: alpha/beta hydrolase [Acidimicrobiales bacterium]|nr:alpha/beta hydrolase [Acidimicrobiales bacterium]
MLKAFADGRLFGATYGTDSRWVLALHGWRRTHRDFDLVLAGLDAVALDLPGFGGATPPPPTAWGPAEYAQAVAPVLDDLGPEVVVLGHSFGGRVALHLAVARPERVRALVVSGAPFLRPPGAPRRRPDRRYRLAGALHRVGVLGDERMEAVRRRHGSADFRAATGVMREVLVRSVNKTDEQQLRAVSCPVELVWGEADLEAPPAVAEAALGLLAHGRLTLRPGVGHFVPTEDAQALRDAVERHRP